MNILGKALFYAPELDSSEVTLSEEESRHCISSLRLREGEVIFLTDGKGTLLEAKITKAHPKATEVKEMRREKEEKQGRERRLVVAPPKAGERLDWLVEKAVEIGVDEVLFIETRYSERDKVNLDRMQKIAIAAMKQSKQLYLPELFGVMRWKQFLEKEWLGTKLLAHIPSEGKVVPLLKDKLQGLRGTEGVTVLIGPEGDFTEEEIRQALEKKFEPVSLGASILRTETAVIYSLVCINAFA